MTDTTKDGRPWTLTRAGWPRPVVAGWPVPWVAPAEHLSEVDTTRRDASASGAICQVCGGDYGNGEMAYGFTEFDQPVTLPAGAYVDELPEVDEDDLVTVLDGSIMHWRCAKLSAARCPHIRDRKALVCLAFPANQGWPRELDGALRPHYAAQYVRLAPWPASSTPEPTFEEPS